MLQNLINPLLIAFTISTTFGVLVHDTQLDRAATVAIALPVILAGYAAFEIKSDMVHTHVERASGPKNHIRPNMPRTPPRNDDHRQLTAREDNSSNPDMAHLWPSV